MAALLKCTRNTDGRTRTDFIGTWDGIPTMAEIEQAQRIKGYAPEGYGGPWDVVRFDDASGQPYMARWHCMGSCD